MKVTEALTFEEFDADPRFEKKKPFRRGSRKQSCGDNIYYRDFESGAWSQRDSFHSLPNGTANPDHISRDTGVNRVLVSDQFIYFGGEGPEIPANLIAANGRPIVRAGIGEYRFRDSQLVSSLEDWVGSLGVGGYQGRPFEWVSGG